ncbi:MAG TPA: Clp protease N-terminal domain-containing protein [Candidatus Binatia bacterium]|jgi:hypothetical protein|nr:Clp protease N-terminal domain-containing protein [Candidatus Binatia bacterium]
MFNLDQAIAQWRQQMLSAGIKSPDVLDELETHLRDEIQRQIHLGADEQHAYQAAVAGIGPAGVLKAEFAKVASGHSHRRRTFLRTFYFISAAFVLLINTWTFLEFEISPLARALGVSAVSLICLYLAGLPYLLKSLPAAPYIRLAKANKVASNLLWLWPIWALLDAEHVVHLEIGIVPTMVLWCLYAAVALTAIAYTLNGRCLPPGDPGSPPPPFQPQPHPIPPAPPCPPDFAASLPPSKPVDPIVHQSLELACGEASRLGHDFIGTEHVLLGVLKLAKGSFANVLRNLNVDREAVRAEIERLVSPVPAHSSAAAIPLTPRARKAMQLAAREAKALDHSCISAEHIFLGLLLEGSGIAAQVLKNLGLHIGTTREEILRELRAHPGC